MLAYEVNYVRSMSSESVFGPDECYESLSCYVLNRVRDPILCLDDDQLLKCSVQADDAGAFPTCVCATTSPIT